MHSLCSSVAPSDKEKKITVFDYIENPLIETECEISLESDVDGGKKCERISLRHRELILLRFEKGVANEEERERGKNTLRVR